MKKLSALVAVILLGTCQASYGMYLFLFQNQSGKNVYLYGEVPGGWVNVPKYPLLLFPGQVLLDGGSRPHGLDAFLAQAIQTAMVHKKAPFVEIIRNVGLPATGKKGPLSPCNKNDVKHYLKIVVDAAQGADRVYRIYDCGWKINVEVRTKDNKWKDYPEELKFDAGTKYWSMIVKPNGGLQLCGDKPGDRCKLINPGRTPSTATRTGDAGKLRYR